MEEKGNVSGQTESCSPVLLSQACFSIFSAFSAGSQECERAKWGKQERDRARWDQEAWNKKGSANRKEAGNRSEMDRWQRWRARESDSSKVSK